MASNRSIVPQQEVEVIPSSQLPGFRESVATMNKLVQDLEPLLPEARNLTQSLAKCDLSDRATRLRAGEVIAILKRIDKDGEEEMKPHKKIIKTVSDYIQTHVRRVTNRVEEAYKPLTNAMGEWDRAEERAAQAERDRVAREKQAALDREAELKRQADADAAAELKKKRIAEIRADLKAGKITLRQSKKLLEEAGAKEEAALAEAAAQEQESKQEAVKVAEKVEVKSAVPAVAGNVRRVNYKAECEDTRMFVSAMMIAYEKKDFKTYERLFDVLEVSDQKLSAEARKSIKTSPQDKNHELTVAEFEALYPFVAVKEDRTY
jgi:hypothetical protein